MSDDLSNVLFATLLLIVAARLAWGLRRNSADTPSESRRVPHRPRRRHHRRDRPGKRRLRLRHARRARCSPWSTMSWFPAPVLLLVASPRRSPGERGALDWLGIKWALVGRVFGTFAGAYALTRLDNGRDVGGARRARAPRRRHQPERVDVRPTTSTLVGAGMVSGVMGTMTSVGGPPMALVYQREQAAKLRSTLAGTSCSVPPWRW